MSWLPHDRWEVATVTAKVIAVLGTAGWAFMGSSASGVGALVAIAYLWIGWWVGAVRARRAGEPTAVRGESAITRSLLGPKSGKEPSQWAIKLDRRLAKRPFAVMGGYFTAIAAPLAGLLLIGGAGWQDVFPYAFGFVAFGTLVGGGIVWLSENKPDTADAVTQAVSQESIKGGPPPF